MFDDPKKDLKWLEEQLLQEEQPREQSGENWLDEEDWLDEELREAHALMDNEHSRGTQRETVFYDYDDEEEEEEELAVYTDVPPKSKAKKEKRKQKGIGGLVFLACLETLGIIAVLMWWVLWLL